MDIRASVESSRDAHLVEVSTDGRRSTVSISGRPAGGSTINGGELLCTAIATCFCNDLYREAARQGLEVESVRVDVSSEFGGPGEPARRITYHVEIESSASPEALADLIRQTDLMAEVHNTLRGGIDVELTNPV